MNVAPFVAVCSELPNDNPGLHVGAVWIPITPTGRPRAISRPPPAVAQEAVPGAPEASARAPEAITSAPPKPEAERESGAVADAFRQLVSLLCQVALGAGATRAAVLLPAFIQGEVVDRAALGNSVCCALIASEHAVPAGAGIVMSESVGVTARAWRAVLTGQSDDLSSCEGTLDSWCADLVAALSGTPARAAEMRRELRRFGVAAFGLLAAAA